LEVKDFFNLYWNKKSLRKFDRYHSFTKLINEKFYSNFSTSKKSRILVIGIGDSPDCYYFETYKSKVVSIDISYKGLRYNDAFMKIQMDANSMGFKRNIFDVVFMRTVLLHLDHRKALIEIKRIMRDGGRLFWIEPMKNNIFLWLYRILVSPGRFTRINYLTFEEVLSIRSIFECFWHSEYYLFSVFLLPLHMLFPGMNGFVSFFVHLENELLGKFKWFKKFCWISYGYGEV